MKSGDIEELLDFVSSRRLNHLCWAAFLEGEAAEALAFLEAREDAGLYINRAGASRAFAEKWGLEVNAEAIRRHLTRGCKCRPGI